MNNIENLSEHQKKLILKVVQQNAFKNYEVQIKNGSKKGDNYVGLITSLKITEKESEKCLNLILKHSKHEDVFRKGDQSSSVFVREAKMYNEILPELLKYQEKAGISNPFIGVANCYGIDIEPYQESILMEDIKSKGYHMWEKTIPIDHEHIVLVFTEYAKFHAISFAMGQKDPQKFEELTKGLTSVMGSTEERKILFVSYKEIALKYIENERIKEALIVGWKNLENDFSDLRNEKLVVQHGDAWSNNMLFKYKQEDLSKPEHLYLLDWQNSKIGSPIWDLVYFFCICGSKEVFPNYKYYLTRYFKILSQNLKEFGCNPDEVFSYESLMDHWQKYAKMGIYCMLMFGQIVVAEESDIPDNFDELRKDKSKTFDDIFHLNEDRQKKYNEKLSDLVEFLLKENLF